MKHAGRKQLPTRVASSSPPPPPPGAHRLSHVIAKPAAPKVRIIHVLAPHVIKTEARHFRDLVQRLTGKPPPQKAAPGRASSSASTGGDASPPTSVSSSCDTASDDGLGAAGAGAASAGIAMTMKAAKEEQQEAEASSPSGGGGGGGGGFLRALELDGYDYGDGYQGPEDFLLSSCGGDMDALPMLVSDQVHAGGFHF